MSFMRPLGSTGIVVSAIGLGTVKLGRNQGVKYPSAFNLPDDNQIRDLLSLAQELGINLLDTAPAYGNSEERLGKLLTNRHDWVLVTKAGEEFEQGKSRFDFSAAHLRASVERSLRRLNTDYLDCVLLHSDGNDLQILQQTEAVATLNSMQQAGWIRSIGLSGKTVAGGIAALEQMDVAMVTYNLAERQEKPVIDYAAEKQRGILVKKAFASGHLDQSITDPVQESLKLSLTTAGVSAVIAGTINAAHLKENVAKAKQLLQS